MLLFGWGCKWSLPLLRLSSFSFSFSFHSFSLSLSLSLSLSPLSLSSSAHSVNTFIDHVTSSDGKIVSLCKQSSFLAPLVSGSMDASELEAIIHDMDTDSDGTISRAELLRFVDLAIERDQDDVLRQLFLLIDTGDGDDETDEADGVVTMGELEHAIKTSEEVKDLLRTVPSLAPLLLPSTRKTAFKAIDQDGDGNMTMKELSRLTHIAREHADREYVAKRSNGKDDVICDSYIEMQKVLRVDAAEMAQLEMIQENERKTKKMSGSDQPKVIVPKRSGVLTSKEIKKRAKEKDAEAKIK